MSKKSGYIRKKPNFHNMGIGALLDFIRRNRGSASRQDEVLEAESWVSKKGGPRFADSEVMDSNYRGGKGNNF